MRNETTQQTAERCPPHTTLVTGATGFIGHYVLAELLSHHQRCVAMLRAPLARSVARLGKLMQPLGIDLEREVAHGRLAFFEGALGAGPIAPRGVRVTRIVHCAGQSRLDEAKADETFDINYGGAHQLLELAEQEGVRELHLVSSAYRCGRMRSPVAEDATPPPSFHNTYERSKWEAECAWRVWGRLNKASVTVYRPSIVVGARRDGRVTRLAGVYLVARAVKMLADTAGPDRPGRPGRLPLELTGSPDSEQNLVPVDYVARMIGHAVRNPRWHGRTYHLTHPAPPTNGEIKRAIEQAFSVYGGHWADKPQHVSTPTAWQATFDEAMQPLLPYLDHQPAFLRHEADRLERAAGLACPRYSVGELAEMFRAADRMSWGKRPKPRPVSRDELALYNRYFFEYLPAHLVRSQVARMTALTCTVRFRLLDIMGGDWVCRFVGGALSRVERDGDSAAESVDFTYQTTRALFWESIRGEVDPQAVFLEGSASITGDLERAMKMAVVLREFNREFPCTRQMLEAPRMEAVA